MSFLKKRIDVKTIPTEALSVLDEREKLIFTGRVQGSTLKSLAIDIGLSATRVGQLEKRVFLKVGAEIFWLHPLGSTKTTGTSFFAMSGV